MRIATLLLSVPPALLVAQADGARPTPGSGPAEQVAAAVNNFSVQLQQQLASKPGNLFLSPYSVAVALTMARAGAEGETAAEMDRVLGLTGLDGPLGHQQLRQLLDERRQLRGEDGKRSPSFELEVAQRVWVQEGLAIEPAFAEVQRDQFATPLQLLDFRQTEAARQAINDWVAERTRNRIQDIVPRGMPTPDTRLALANAIYFKAAWADAFRPKLTKDGEFTTAGGDVVTVPMMHRQLRIRHASWDGGEAVEIPFAGGDTALWVVLPPPGSEPAAVAAQMDSAGLAALQERLTSRLVDLKLPRFSFTDAHELGSVLQAMGMLKAFRFPGAEFGGIAREEPLVLGAVLHKAFLAVDEAGTEAAAATVVMVRAGSPPRPEEPVSFHANRPFWFAIRHRSSGCLLFVGRLVAPGA